MEPDNSTAPAGGFDLANLLEFTGGDKTLALKYIGIFVNTSAVQLINIQNAWARTDANMLFNALHTLKPQLELIGIKTALRETEKTLNRLRENRVMTDANRNSALYIFDEINLACAELETIQKNGL